MNSDDIKVSKIVEARNVVRELFRDHVLSEYQYNLLMDALRAPKLTNKNRRSTPN